MPRGYIAFDLDGTLAYYNGDISTIGDPIMPMVNLLKNYLKKGYTVKIFTARATDVRQIPLIQKWLVDNDIGLLEITNVKDMGMILLYDDRAIQVVHNTGKVIS